MFKITKSRPARGAWIEIPTGTRWTPITSGRAPQGARGLKFVPVARLQHLAAVAPRKGRVD